jgi:hypothetical protein
MFLFQKSNDIFELTLSFHVIEEEGRDSLFLLDVKTGLLWDGI